MEVKVRHKRDEFVVRASTYEELVEAVRERTGVELVKVVARGRVLGPGDELASSVLVVGTSEEEAAAMARAAEDAAAERLRRREREVIDDLGAEEVAEEEESEEGVVFGSSLSEVNAVDGRETGFGSVTTLPLPDSPVAEKLLRRLARDVGIRAVMKRRGWFVPVLAEMPPDGKVGVDPVCVLGLNENKGQRILLRLRTDDLAGFRKFLAVKQVLYHELAHNERSEHDAVFYGLVSQIHREAEAEATFATGHRLGGARRLARPRAPRAGRQAGQRLGGPSSPPPPREPPPGEGGQSGTLERGHPASAHPTRRRREAEPAEPTRPERAAADPAATIRDDGSDWAGVAPDSPEAKILAASRDLQAAVADPSRRREAATTLQIILHNAAQPDDKYKRIRLDNKRFLRTAGKYAAAIRFLEACGFSRVAPGGPSENSDVLLLRRNDPALLWLGRAALEGLVAA